MAEHLGCRTCIKATEFSSLGFEDLLGALGDGLVIADDGGQIVLAQGDLSGRLGIETGRPFSLQLPELSPSFEQVLLGEEDMLSCWSDSQACLAWLKRVEDVERRVFIVCLLLENAAMECMAARVNDFERVVAELDAIIDSSTDGLLICDADGTVIRINPASESINQTSAEQVVGRNMRELLRQGTFECSAALEAIRTGDKVSLLAKSRGRQLIFTGTPVKDNRGRVVRVVVSENDVTEIDRLQRQLEEQEAIKEQLSSQILEMQLADLEESQIVARSPQMVHALRQAIKVSKAESSVLILGESGVGKGVVADLIHQNSARCNRPMIKINCGAIPESLIESELFGYEKGAFTGAQTGKPGHFELADGGILFLDEIAELPLQSQVKLLRFLEDGQIVRLGGTRGQKVDVRILAATNRDLEEMVAGGQFRQDLYYRLNVIPLSVPAVRERGGCVLPLVKHYIDDFSRRNGLKKKLSQPALAALQNYSYPGNVRELMNICERLVVMSDAELIDLEDLPPLLVSREPGAVEALWQEGQSLQEAMDQVEKKILRQVMSRTPNQTGMAEVLGVTQATIARKMQKFGLKKNRRTLSES